MDGAIEARKAWKSGVTNARREAMAYPGTRGSPVRELDGEKFRFEVKRGARFATTRAIPIRQKSERIRRSPSSSSRSGGSIVESSRKFVHRDEDLVNYLLSI